MRYDLSACFDGPPGPSCGGRRSGLLEGGFRENGCRNAAKPAGGALVRAFPWVRPCAPRGREGGEPDGASCGEEAEPRRTWRASQAEMCPLHGLAHHEKWVRASKISPGCWVGRGIEMTLTSRHLGVSRGSIFSGPCQGCPRETGLGRAVAARPGVELVSCRNNP